MDLIFYLIYAVLAVVIVASSIGLILSRNAIYAALFLVLNFMTVALLYIALGAPYIALAQVTVYAGSIMVLFLFVIMLLGGEQLPDRESLRGQRWMAALVGGIFLVELAIFIGLRGAPTVAGQPVTPDFSTPETLGLLLFDRYLLPFEMTAGLLLIATVGAIFLTRHAKSTRQEAAPTGIEGSKE